MTAATIFPASRGDGMRSNPEACVVGAAKNASSLRDADVQLEKILLGDAKPEGVIVEATPLADSPVQVRSIRREHDYGNGYGQISAFLAAVKGRLMAVKTTYAWGQAEERQKAAARFSDGIGELLGIVRTAPGGWKLGELPALAPGDTFLGRFVLRFHRNAAAPDRMAEREQQEVKQLWFWGWDGLQCQLVAGKDGVLRERIEFRRVPEVERAFLDCFRDGERGLGDVASHLPANTLAACRVSLDLDKTTQWAYAFEGFDRTTKEDIREFLHYFRKLLGLDPKAKALEQADPTLHGLDDVTMVLLPGAAGSPAPELALLVRCEPRPDQAPDVLNTVVDLMRPLMSGEMAKKLEIRTTGTGEDTVHALRFKDLFGSEGGMSRAMDTVALSLLGGGYLSATRAGPYFVLGCNPRTTRSVVEAVRSGDTLDKRADFAAVFPKGKPRALEAWCDLPQIANSMKAFDAIALMFLGFAPMGATVKLPPIPSFKDLAPALRVEWLASQKADFGWVVDHEGGTMLSPVAWAAVGYAATTLDVFERMIR
jgi:hypothetical protein